MMPWAPIWKMPPQLCRKILRQSLAKKSKFPVPGGHNIF
jgi:hypothetical protein